MCKLRFNGVSETWKVCSKMFLFLNNVVEPGNLLLLSVQGPSEPCGVNMTYEGEGIYNVSFHPREKGVHVITIKWGKRYITGSPFIVTVD